MQQEKTPKEPKQVACPNCKSLSVFSPENPFRPFCSKRCKMIDLGEWASESYKIPEKTPPKDINEEG